MIRRSLVRGVCQAILGFLFGRLSFFSIHNEVVGFEALFKQFYWGKPVYSHKFTTFRSSCIQ